MTTNEVLAFLRLLEKSPKIRRSCVVLQCNCQRCGGLAVEVIRTPDAFARLVAIHYPMKDAEDTRGPVLPTAEGLQRKGLRAASPRVTVLLAGQQDGLEVACECGKKVVAVATLLNAVQSGAKKIVLDTPG